MQVKIFFVTELHNYWPKLDQHYLYTVDERIVVVWLETLNVRCWGQDGETIEFTCGKVSVDQSISLYLLH